VIAVYGVVLVIEGYVLVPIVMGHSMQLNATTVMLACLFWDLVWGLPGLFLAMPLMAAVKAICTNVPDWRPWANLMSTPKGELHALRMESAAAQGALDETQLLTPEEIKGLEARQRSAIK
jgi:hypothetical protein